MSVEAWREAHNKDNPFQELYLVKHNFTTAGLMLRILWIEVDEKRHHQKTHYITTGENDMNYSQITTEANKPFMCPQWRMSFSSKGNLNGKSFRFKRNNAHMRNHWRKAFHLSVSLWGEFHTWSETSYVHENPYWWKDVHFLSVWKEFHM